MAKRKGINSAARRGLQKLAAETASIKPDVWAAIEKQRTGTEPGGGGNG